ncbi:Hypothetical predicted protein [Mytilus galloprovincialis]|nr:Hypothetical predicted protein [Mytilus galloprovincialis]
MASGVGDTMNSICRYLKVEDVRITTSIKSDCHVTIIMYYWQIYIHKNGTQYILLMDSINESLPTLSIARDELLKENVGDSGRGIFAAELYFYFKLDDSERKELKIMMYIHPAGKIYNCPPPTDELMLSFTDGITQTP